MKLRLLVSVVIAFVALHAHAADVATTDHFGIEVADPYRSLEDLEAPATRTWVDAQAATTRARLDSLPGRQALLDTYASIDARQRPAIASLQMAGPPGTVFYLKRMPGRTDQRLFVRPPGFAERPLSDEADAVDAFAPSHDGKRVIVVATRSKATTLTVVDTTSGTKATRVVDDVWSGASPRWTTDERGFYFVGVVHEDGSAFATPSLSIRQYRFDTDEVRTVTGWEAGYQPGDALSVIPSDDGRTFFVAILDRRTRAWRVVFARSDTDPMTWSPLIEADADVRAIAVHGSQVFARTMADATLGRIVRYDADRPADPPVAVVVGKHDGVLQDVVAAADGLYFSVRTGYEVELARLTYGTGRTTKIVLPARGNIKSLAGDASREGVVLGLEGWTRPVAFLRVHRGRASVLAIQEPADSIGRDWVSDNLSCRTSDGVAIPMVAIHRKDFRHDGRHPLILNGYGAYGFVEPAYFYAKSDPWIRRGGVFVDFMARGSGATGEAWHRAGMGATKANSWNDLIACAQTLIARGYTTPERLVVQGTAIGGLMVGRAMTERPDLFAAAVIRWGITDALRFIESPMHLPADEVELGRADSAAGVAQLLDATVDAHLRDDVRYPAVLLTTGLKDQRFPPWMAFKTAARLATTRTTPDRPVLLRVDPDGGATQPMSADQRNAELADRIAFMLWRLGDPDFQPRD